MTTRTKLLVHLRRISNLIESAIQSGPEGTLEGKFAAEQPMFVHYACAFYLIGCLAYLEGEDGKESWKIPFGCYPDFDSFAVAYPAAPRPSFKSQGIHLESLQALVNIRNAVVHHDGDLAKLDRAKKADVVAEVQKGNVPGLSLNGTVVSLESSFLDFVRKATLAVRNYRGES
jgi:hypothetical protein